MKGKYEMASKKGKKGKIGKIVDIIMMLCMVLEIFYVFEGNLAHEIIGVIFFIGIFVHIYIKRKWLKSFLKKSNSAITFSKVIIGLLVVSIIVLIITSIGVSRSLFTKININSSKEFHQLCFVIVTVLTVIHIGMHGYVRKSNKKKIVIWTSIIAVVLALTIIFLVPYMDRHFKTVNIGDYKKIVQGEHIDTKKKVLAVYFTRLGNTDFDSDVDAVSGASLMNNNGELMGNTQLMADMVKDALGCDVKAITLKNKEDHYPSSYSKTCMVAKEEFDKDKKPEIEKIDVSKYDDIILIYPIWWYKIPMPVASFLESGNFANKKIYLLATSGSSGFANSTKDVEKYAKDAKVIEGLSVYCDDIPKSREDIGEWLKSVKDEF